MPHKGTFVLADFSGYTGYLDAAGLQHASNVTAKLLNSLIGANAGYWQVANLEGDCIFFYREGREPPAQLLKHLRRLFDRFFTRVLEMGQDTDCGCGACGGSNQLALKFIVHAGEYAEQRVGGRRELIGADVITAHRLLKSQTPVREYVLFTSAYLGEDDLGGQPIRQIESHDLPCCLLDLAPVRRETEARHAVFVPERRAVIRLVAQIDAPTSILWGALLNADKLSEWAGASQTYGFPGAMGTVGTVFRLIMPDGRDFVQLVIAAEGRQRVTFRRADVPFTRYVYTTYELRERGDGGTDLRCYLGAEGSVPVLPALSARRILKAETEAAVSRLKAYCEAEPRQ